MNMTNRIKKQSTVGKPALNLSPKSPAIITPASANTPIIANKLPANWSLTPLSVAKDAICVAMKKSWNPHKA